MEYPSMMVSSRSAQQPKKGVFDMVQKYRKLAGAVAAAACLGILFSFAPVRTWAAQFLTLFRVQKRGDNNNQCRRYGKNQSGL